MEINFREYISHFFGRTMHFLVVYNMDGKFVDTFPETALPWRPFTI